MNEDQLIRSVQARAANEKTRTDFADIHLPPTFEALSEADLCAIEHGLGFKLAPLHRRLLVEIGNGGFGPGYGIVGGPDGYLDDDGSSFVEVRKKLWAGRHEGLPGNMLPLCDWGDAIWSCIDSKNGRILTLDHIGLTESEYDITTWLAEWAAGVQLFEKLFEFEDVDVVNPFTKQQMKTKVPSRPTGKRLIRYCSL
jgi:hypothetical protein